MLGTLRWELGRTSTSRASTARLQAALASCATLVALAPSVAIADGGPPSRSATSLRAVLEAVIRSAPDLERLHGPARRSAWMPALVRAEVRWDDGSRENSELRISQDYDEAALLDSSDVRDTTSWLDDRGRVVRLQIGWDLRGAVFSRDALAIEAAARSAERDLLSRVERATAAWTALMSRCAVPPDASPERLASAALEWVVAEQTLSVLTGGWYAPGGAVCVGSEVALTR